MRDFAYSWITEQPILGRGPLCRDANNTESMLFCHIFRLRAIWAKGRGVQHDLAYTRTERIGAHFGQVPLVCLQTPFLVHNA